MKKRALLIFCVIGFLMFFSTVAPAQLTIADGGASGQFYNPSRSGEGINVEVIETSTGTSLVVNWYTFDQYGEQMWLSGIQPIGDEATRTTIDVFIVEGPIFGPDFDPEDVVSTKWGTLDLSFPTCDEAILSYASILGFGVGTIPQVRISKLVQVECDETSIDPGVTPGRWKGSGICLFVSADGRTLTTKGSTCDNGVAADINANGIQGNGNACLAEFECTGDWAIVNGAFSCYSGNRITTGVFDTSGNDVAGGLALTNEAVGGNCIAAWEATPD